MVVRDAMAHGRAVVATEVGGLADRAGAGVTLVPDGDRAALRLAYADALGAS